MQDENVYFFCDDEPAESDELLIFGMGTAAAGTDAARLKNQFSIDVNLVPPETRTGRRIKNPSSEKDGAERRSGGRGQFGHVFLELEPLPPGGGFEFVDKIFSGTRPHASHR